MAAITSTTSQAALLAVEMLSDEAIVASLPRAVMLGMVHYDNSLVGARTSVLRIPVESDLGIAAGGAEGVAPGTVPTVEIGMGTSVTATATKGVLDIFEMTEEAIAKTLGIPFEAVLSVLQNGTREQFEAMLARNVMRVMTRGILKLESDLLALIPSITASVGNGTESFGAARALEAIFTQRVNQPLRPLTENEFLLAPEQTYELDQEALVGSGYASNLWVNQAGYVPASAKSGAEYETRGIVGHFLNYTIREMDAELAPLTAADATVNGAFGAFGIPGVSPKAPQLGGRPGAFGWIEQSPLAWKFSTDLDKGTCKGRLTSHYDMLEVAGQNVVNIATGHTA